MKRILMAAGAAMALALLGGCATTIRSDVITFHQWPAELPDKSYVFEAPPPAQDTLELRSYQGLVRGELARLGFREVAAAPALKVSMRFSTTGVPVRVIRAVDPFFYSPSQFGFMHPSPFHRRGYWRGSFRSPLYDPFWSPMPAYEAVMVQAWQRELQVAIKAAPDNRALFDVTVHNLSGSASTPAIMPAMVRSAFEGFPGPSGVARRVELKLKD